MVTIVNRIVNKQEVGTLANGMQLERSEASATQGKSRTMVNTVWEFSPSQKTFI